MPVMQTLGRAATATARGTRAAATRVATGSRWVGRGTGRVRSAVSGGETGMIRLFDLHAAAIAGDTLIAIGLAGTIFFDVPLGEARGNVALYLLVTMVPFAVLAPMVGPLLDHFRHGRRYALAATMFGRAILAWLLADNLDDLALYPVAFGVLVLSRAYGVARAAAVPRLLPQRLTLSQVNARGSVYGTLAGIAVLPLGLAAFAIGGGWPLRVAAVIFLIGMVIALRLPAHADSGRPETLPRLFRLTWLRRDRDGDRVLSGRLVVATLIGSVGHRALYGFLLIFLAFAIRADQLPTTLVGRELGQGGALGLVSGTLVAGTFLAVAGGTRLRIRRPMALQATGLLVVAAVALLATVRYALPLVVLLCLVAAISSGLAKLAVDSAIQERIEERLRATAFAHSETLLMLAFVAGSAIGLIPMPGHAGVGIAAGLLVLTALRTVVAAVALRNDLLSGRPVSETSDVDGAQKPAGGERQPAGGPEPAGGERKPADAGGATPALPAGRVEPGADG
jgi:MFS family permease